jgi:hypothetical protein
MDVLLEVVIGFDQPWSWRFKGVETETAGTSGASEI